MMEAWIDLGDLFAGTRNSLFTMDKISSIFTSEKSTLNLLKRFALEHKVLTGTTLVAGYIIIKYLRRQKNLPPGPRGWPILGAYTELKHGDKIHLDFCRLGEQYGDVFSMYMGDELWVILNSHDAVKECFVTRGTDFAGKGQDTLGLRTFDFKDELILPTYNQEFKENKKFAVQAFRLSGLGSKEGEDKVMKGVNRMLRYFRDKNGEVFTHGYTDFNRMTSQIITSLLFDKNYDWDDPELKELSGDVIDSSFDALLFFFKLDVMATLMPEWVAKLIYRSKIKKAHEGFDRMRGYIYRRIEEHKKTFDENNLRDFLDVYIKEQNTRGFDERTFADTVMMFIPDAINTIGYSLHWIMFFITANPEVQAKAQKQVDQVVGSSRPVTWNDKHSLPYLEAIIMETMRLAPPSAVSGSHAPLVDQEIFRGYKIRKARCQIMANFPAIHMDPTQFPEPEKFNPSRYIDAENVLVKNDRIIPFSMGRRKCTGEQLVKIELFLFLSNLLQQFTLKFPDGETPPTKDDLLPGFFTIHSPFKICAIPRQ